MATIHDNQRECGDIIKKAFDEEGFPYILLLAQMQMGKSGTYWYVIFEMLFDTTNGIDNIIVMSGNRERDLYDQVKSDFKHYTKWYIMNKFAGVDDDVSLKREIKKKCEDNIQILWGTTLTNKKRGMVNVKDNTLIVWDEAHYAQSKNNAPDAFFVHNGLDNMINGSMDLDEIKKRNIKLLNVSATPFSELIVQSFATTTNSSTSTSPPPIIRKMVKLIPSDMYCGMESYMKRNLIKPSFRISEDTYSDLKDLITRYADTNNPKYMIFRTTDNKESQSLVQRASAECNVICKLFNSEEKEIDMDDLKEEPSRPTVIIVSGMLRMGKVVPKDYIAMVFESVTKAKSKKTDTGLQGLLGRMCGYASDEHGFDIDIYIEEYVIEEAQVYLDGYDSPQGPQNTHAMNVRRRKKIKQQDKTIATIFKLPNNPLFHSKTGGVKVDYLSKWLRDHFNELNMDDLLEEEIDEIKETITTNDSALKFKNLNSKCNQLLREHLMSGCREIAINVPKNSYYVCKEKTTESEDVWLILNRIPTATKNKDNHEEEGNAPQIYSIVSNNCVFKPVVK